ncbi:MAG TPA: hypothetical protein DEF59_01730 [Candidatus Magasanikbacteria bacterium]|nr:hypothetical protein [Candidatus Magasanikbacteria bacterium]
MGHFAPLVAHQPPVPDVYAHHSPLCAVQLGASYAGHGVVELYEHQPVAPSEFLHHLPLAEVHLLSCVGQVVPATT